jgi:hypothetical protein
VQQNATALSMARQGLQYQCWNPPARNFNPIFTGVRGFLDLARLFALEAQVRRGRGDWNGAMNSSLDGVKFGSDIQRGGIGIAALYGMSCEGTARSEAWPNIPVAVGTAGSRRYQTTTLNHGGARHGG